MPAPPLPHPPVPAQLADNARAFDAASGDYDGPSGNNALVQVMRGELWNEVARRTFAGASLLDLGCGTGIDAAHFAAAGYAVTAVDASAGMVARTLSRARAMRLNLRVAQLGIERLAELRAVPFDAIYSDLGPLNCVPDLAEVSRAAAPRLKPRGFLIASVMGRICAWEQLYYTARRNGAQRRRRAAREPVPVQLGAGTVWTRYYSPGEFYAAFAREFELVAYRALNLFLPPPYLIHWYARARWLMPFLRGLDRRLGALPALRNAGDHFLMTLRKRAEWAAR